MMQNASTSNATEFQEKRITPSRDTHATLCENSFCESWHLLLHRVTFINSLMREK